MESELPLGTNPAKVRNSQCLPSVNVLSVCKENIVKDRAVTKGDQCPGLAWKRTSAYANSYARFSFKSFNEIKQITVLTKMCT